MQIIFHHISYYSLPIALFLKLFNLKIFYLYFSPNLKNKNNLFNYLKRKNINSLPIEHVKKIKRKYWIETDSDIHNEVNKYSKKLCDESYLKKIGPFFKVEKKILKIRVMINEYLFIKNFDAVKIKIWADNNLDKKILFLSFNFSGLFANIDKINIYKIVIPINFIFYVFNIIFTSIKIFFIKKKISKTKSKKYNLNFKDKVCLINNHGTNYGEMFKKDIFYSSNPESQLYEKKILHLSYDNTPMNKVKTFSLICSKTETIKLILKNLSSILKFLFISVLNNKIFITIIFIKYFIQYKKFEYKLKNFKNLKIALIDFDFMCPRELILALQSNDIKTIAVQERPLTSFYKSWGVILDEYYVNSIFFKNQIKFNKNLIVNNITPLGPYRVEWLNDFRKKVPKLEKDILLKKRKFKKLIIVLGYTTEREIYSSNVEILTNWSSHKHFLTDIISLSKKFTKNLFVLRFKNIEWTKIKFFKHELNEILKCENIILSTEYKKNRYLYSLISKADLIIAKYTSAADEALSLEIPVIFHDYTVNLAKTIHGYNKYFENYLFCHSYEELLKSTKYILLNSKKAKQKIKKINAKVHKYDKILYNFKIKHNLINSIERKLKILSK